ncbi:transposase [Bradyrhizobium sp. CW7]|uniref:transposase n=1 Tax=Bradyrhizobium sp. CW7 TaxID=2782688 RepID=UPI0021116CFF|nr:transposase [Bradyrhizobium sp. CW7]
MAMNARNRRLEPAYKQHTAVDDKIGVILDVAVTTGQTNEGEMIELQVDEVKRYGHRPQGGHRRRGLCLR